ncbi:hypothetical protein GCK32_019476, partial [Trichostrongylus colubriformis]
SKYFRNPNDFPIRVEQADFPELDVLCTEHSLTVEINQIGRDPSHSDLSQFIERSEKASLENYGALAGHSAHKRHLLVRQLLIALNQKRYCER